MSDLIEGIYRLFLSEEPGPVNIGNPGEFTVLELARKVIAMTGSRSEIEFRPLPQDDPKQRKPDITLARRALGWEPQVDLDEGRTRTIPAFRRQVEKTGAVARAL